MTPNLSLPLIAASQAQKHITANEAALGFDALAQLSVIDVMDLPASAGDGDCYILGMAPSGAFAGGTPGDVAAFYGEWSFYTPKAGWIAFVQSESKFRAYSGASWVLLSTLL